MTSNPDLAPNTDLTCSICGEKIGSVCMLSPDWSALDSFRNQTRSHFEEKHDMKKQTGTDIALVHANLNGLADKITESIQELRVEGKIV